MKKVVSKKAIKKAAVSKPPVKKPVKAAKAAEPEQPKPMSLLEQHLNLISDLNALAASWDSGTYAHQAYCANELRARLAQK